MCRSTCARATKSKFRVLYVGSDSEAVGKLRESLANEQIRLIACADRLGAVLFLKSHIRYDLVMFEGAWQDEEGLSMARLLTSLRHRKKTPVMVVDRKAELSEVSAAVRESIRRLR